MYNAALRGKPWEYNAETYYANLQSFPDIRREGNVACVFKNASYQAKEQLLARRKRKTRGVRKRAIEFEI